jgi:predicted amidohydrolase
MTEVTLAAANVKITHDKKANLARLLELAAEAAACRADILVLPELALQGYIDFGFSAGTPEYAAQKRYFLDAAEPIPGPATDVLQEAARRSGMCIQLGMAESVLHGNVVFNSTALIGPEGVVGVYRKLHNQAEYPFFAMGESTPVFDLPAARAASMICYDLNFPELMRAYALQGAEIVLMSTAWPMRGHDAASDYYGEIMNLAARANAFFNQSWLVISNHCETNAYSRHVDYFGNSQIIAPTGQVVARLDQQEGLAVHTADLRARVFSARNEAYFGLNLIHDRRPEHYQILSRGYGEQAAEPPGAASSRG